MAEEEARPTASPKRSRVVVRVPSVFGIAFLILLTCKALGLGPAASVSWWWLAIPLLAPAVGLAAVLLVVGLVLAVAALCALIAAAGLDWLERRERARALAEQLALSRPKAPPAGGC